MNAREFNWNITLPPQKEESPRAIVDYNHLLTWWLLGPAFIILFFLFGALGWLYYTRTRDGKRKAELAASARYSKLLAGQEENARGSTFSSREERTTLDLSFENLSLKLRSNGKFVLQNVSGKLTHGRMCAVMGPSGAGKTTFMTTLAGKASYGRMMGTVLINGKAERITKFKNRTGFVPQEDVMHRNMTVRETLTFAALSRLPPSMPYHEKLAVVDEHLQLLELQDLQHTLIGDEAVRGISGGQRKRVNIGIELVADPTLLFLDEPTSGLDSSSSMSVCRCLRRITMERGLTLLAVIHQPRYEIFTMFHDVLLLGKGGRTVYFGPTERALPYFESLGMECPNHMNPADFFLDTISGAATTKEGKSFTTDELVQLWSTASERMVKRRRTRSNPTRVDKSISNKPSPSKQEESANTLQVPTVQNIPKEEEDADFFTLPDEELEKIQGPAKFQQGANRIGLRDFWNLLKRDWDSLIREAREIISKYRSKKSIANDTDNDNASVNTNNATEHTILVDNQSYSSYQNSSTSTQDANANIAVDVDADETVDNDGINIFIDDGKANNIQPEEVKDFFPKRDNGSFFTFIFYFICCFIFFPIVGFAIIPKKASLSRRYGGILGFCLAIFASTFVPLTAWLSMQYTFKGLFLIGIIAFVALPFAVSAFLFIVMTRRYLIKKDTPHAEYFFGGMFFSFIYIFFVWNRRTTTIKKRMAAVFGFASWGWIVAMAVTSYAYLRSVSISGGLETSHDRISNWPLLALGVVWLLSIAFVVAMLIGRIHILPAEREKPASWYQALLIAQRGYIQYTRAWLSTLFDLVLVILAGFFIGVILYNQYYVPPLIDSLNPAECPENAPKYVCTALNIPGSNPISAQAAVTCLALALAAVASGMRIFGDEKVVFARESAAGLSTEAYYVGKSMSHYATELLAPLMFTLCFYAFILPAHGFWKMFLLYFLVYWGCAALAFFISLVTPNSMSQLAGVLTVLSFMMFSGAEPTLSQLNENQLVPYVFYFCGNFSIFRWAEELYFIIALAPYNPAPNTGLLKYYSYAMDDELLCWFALLGLALLFRFLAYAALVLKEKRN